MIIVSQFNLEGLRPSDFKNLWVVQVRVIKHFAFPFPRMVVTSVLIFDDNIIVTMLNVSKIWIKEVTTHEKNII